MRNSVTLGLAATVCAIGSVCCYQLAWNQRPVKFLGDNSSGSYEQRIQSLLGLSANEPVDAHAADVPPDGFERPILQFRPRAGGIVRVVLVEGDFEDTTVLPLAAWKARLDSNYVLVNSVDDSQHVERIAGIAGRIGLGCNLKPYVGETLNFGEVWPHECDPQSRYGTLFGAGRVVNAAIVVDTGSLNGHPPCWRWENQAQHRDCMRYVVAVALTGLFDQQKDYVDGTIVVLPALGTGHGKLPKDDFYDLLSHQTRQELASRPVAWNTTLDLLVWRHDTSWREVRQAIATRFGTLALDWNKEDSGASPLWFTAGILFAMTLAFASGAARPNVMPANLSAIASTSIAVAVVGWFAASWGVLAPIRIAESALQSHLPSGWGYALAGAVSACVGIPLTQAMSRFKPVFEGRSSAKPEVPVDAPTGAAGRVPEED